MPNPNSEAFHSHLGFQTVGTFANAGYKLGKWRDIKWFQLSLLEYEEGPEEPLRIWDVDYKNIL